MKRTLSGLPESWQRNGSLLPATVPQPLSRHRNRRARQDNHRALSIGEQLTAAVPAPRRLLEPKKGPHSEERHGIGMAVENPF